ncbi:MAG: WG repeat-containing protein, partial [Bryobacterales bacterium]|nr:WG repeat-containing protein [Bryobacterales bacterium]
MLYPISVPKPNSAEDLIGFINAEGHVVVRPCYAGGSYFSEGKAAVVDWNGKSGFIDDLGELVIPCRFKGLGKFRNGLCSINGGFIDHSGEWLIEPRFLVASNFSEGCAFVSLDGETFGFIDLRGDTVIRPDFQQCRSFSEGLAGVCHDDRWGYIDHGGQIRIPQVFEGVRVQGFRSGIAGVQIDGRWGFVDHCGNFVIKPEYEDLKSFSEGCAPVRREGKWGLINLDG